MSINIAILWHMHQPYYYDPLKNKFMLPWVRLHATKDYLDMLLILKKFPEIKVTFNLVPSLLKQIREYEQGATDIFFEHSIIRAEDLTLEQRVFILDNFFLANWETMIRPFPRYRELLEKRGKTYGDLESIAKKFTSQEIRDIQLLFNLVWIDPLHREEDSLLKDIQKKGMNFSEEEKDYVLEKHLQILRKIIPTYREMANSGQIEISLSPFYHPILPLIYDNYKARECMPWVILPENHFRAPEDAEAQIKRAIKFFEETFQFQPKGMWPSEGAVSEEVLSLIKSSGIQWVATDEDILAKSLGISLRAGEKLLHPETLYCPYNFEGLNIFFRDRVLSDLIGFVYSNWDAHKATEDFVARVKEAPENSLISIILDGENAWEYYKKDGLDFLNNLYYKIQREKNIRTVTFSEYLSNYSDIKPLRKVFPGSWINANFSIWIGHEEDNLSWDYLYKVRNDLINFQRENPHIDMSEAWEAIYICEGSDWNWWYGDEHYTETKDVFDEIYRHNLMNIYIKIGKESPAFLEIPISKKMKEIKPELEPRGFIYPKIDGKITGYFEWLEAGKFSLKRLGGSMHKSEGLLSELYYGFNKKFLYVRLDPHCSLEEFKNLKFNIQIIEPQRIKIVWDPQNNTFARLYKEKDEAWIESGEIDSIAIDQIFEIEIPLEKIGIKEEEEVSFFIEVLKNNNPIDRAPTIGFIKVKIPHPEFEKLMWL